MKNSFVFFGTPLFAEMVLDKLIQAGNVPAVVICNPDRPVGRKKIMTPPPVKARIMNYEPGIRNKIKIWQPEKLDVGSWMLEVGELDFGIVAAYAKIIKKEILDIPKKGTIGVHPSLLPKYRGASPIQSVILSGEEETGATLYLMDEKMDHGSILASSKLQIANSRCYSDLLEELAELGGDLLVETLPKFLAGEVKPVEQNHDLATFTKKFSIENAFVAEEDLRAALASGGEKAIKIDRMIRALNPEPGVWTCMRKPKQGSMRRAHANECVRVKLLESEIQSDKLVLRKIQMEGKKPTTDAAWLN